MDPSATGAPPVAMANADVTMQCPNQEPVSGKTDAQGRFEISALGFLSRDCELVVDAPGYEPVRTPVDEACEKRWRLGQKNCFLVAVDAKLHPASEPPTPRGQSLR